MRTTVLLLLFVYDCLQETDCEAEIFADYIKDALERDKSSGREEVPPLLLKNHQLGLIFQKLVNSGSLSSQ